MNNILIISSLLFLFSCGDSSQDDTPAVKNTNSIEITWQDNSDNEDEFIVYKRFSEEVEFEAIAYLPENSTYYKEYGIDTNSSYCYKIGASNNYGEALSNEQCISIE